MTLLYVEAVLIDALDGHHDPYERISKELTEEVKIGRKNGDITCPSLPFISADHGRIFLEEGLFTEHLDYEDYSSKGTNIISWDEFKATTRFVHREKVKIKSGDWIVICLQGKQSLVIIPTVE